LLLLLFIIIIIYYHLLLLSFIIIIYYYLFYLFIYLFIIKTIYLFCNGPSFSVLDAERDCRKGSSDAGFGRV